MKCKICGQSCEKHFSALVLEKYQVNYFFCQKCEFLQTEEAFWLEEAYREPINLSDTGLLSRNIYFSKVTATLIYSLFNKDAAFLDYAGGFGIFTRLMRDIGFDYYWYDPYTQNLLAKNYEYDLNRPIEIELMTVFESFEHFVNPLEELETMLRVSKNILFSTMLLPIPTPEPSQWWYYGFEHGQHVSFYSPKTLKVLVHKYDLHLNTHGNLHLITTKKINPMIFRVLKMAAIRGLSAYVSKRMKSRTSEDMNNILQKRQFVAG
jgi:hypothetical protein